MGPRLLCFVGGATLTAFHVHLGLLATPFFGSGALLWVSVFASFLLALALGSALGDLLSRLAGITDLKHAAPRLAVLGGVGAWLACWALPEVCRAVLARDARWPLAPAAALTIVALVPGTLIAAVVPSEMRARLGASDAAGMSRSAMRLLGLMTLGGVVGLALLCAKPLLRADETDVFPWAYLNGALLVFIGAACLDVAERVVAGALVAGCLTLSAVNPSEIQDDQFGVALGEAWKKQEGAGRYYLRTAHAHLLSDAELKARAEQLARESAGFEKPGVILTCEMLLALGEVTVTGEGVRNTLELLLEEQARTYIMPIFEPIESIRSDGKGLLHFRIRRTRGVEGAYFTLPGGKPGETIRFWLRDDFTIHIRRAGTVWRLELGPVTIEHAGVFELNDTRKTPLRILDVALWIDASLLAILIDDQPDHALVQAVAQGDVGGIKTREVKKLQKAKRR